MPDEPTQVCVIKSHPDHRRMIGQMKPGDEVAMKGRFAALHDLGVTDDLIVEEKF